MSIINVVPKEFYNDIPVICAFKYSVKKLILNESITFTILLLDQNSKILQVTEVIMDGEDYKNWTNDDTYVINFISKKLFLILPPPENLLALANNEPPSVWTLSDPQKVETPVDETPVDETPVVETPVVETPVVETPVVETPVVETPVDEKPVVETPVDETPVIETPVVETPVDETLVDETPVVESPVDETPVDETPVVETSVHETPVDETPVE